MYNIEELKKEYIGKEFGWLTVLDVYRENSVLYFKCQCKCGNIITRTKKSILSNNTRSCGCYAHSKEKSDKIKVLWAHNDVAKKLLSVNRSERCKNDKYKQIVINSNKLRSKLKRLKLTYNALKNKVDYYTYNKLVNGEIRAEDKIKIRCDKCNSEMLVKLNSIYVLERDCLKTGKLPICKKCKSEFYSSKYEQEISDYVSTFYSGELIRNSRDIISPQELDLYYPEKKIAIEFNGDYWHSTEFKEKDYHYNKFIKCRENWILLVSIFESEWNNKKEEIKEYLKDLFNGKENKLSFNENKTLMNNNYPLPNINIKLSIIQEDYYTFNNHNIFTCGYSIL